MRRAPSKLLRQALPSSYHFFNGSELEVERGGGARYRRRTVVSLYGRPGRHAVFGWLMLDIGSKSFCENTMDYERRLPMVAFSQPFIVRGDLNPAQRNYLPAKTETMERCPYHF